MMFLEDALDTFQYQIAESEFDGKSGLYKIKGVVSRAGVKNKNGRIYPTDVMCESVEAVQKDVEEGGFVGELDHPSSPKVNVNKISHKITKLVMASDGAVLSEMVVLDTPEGEILKKLIKGGVRLGVSTRGLGQVKPSRNQLGESVLEVQKGFQMKAIDVVFDPSAGQDGRPSFVSESTDYKNKFYMGGNASLDKVFTDVFGDKYVK